MHKNKVNIMIIKIKNLFNPQKNNIDKNIVKKAFLEFVKKIKQAVKAEIKVKNNLDIK